MISVDQDEADPFKAFFVIAGFYDLGATSDDFEAIEGSDRKHEE